jgi:hypothetical protein
MCLGLIACGQKAAPPAPATPGWNQSATAADVLLTNQAAADAPAFGLVCAKTGTALTLTAPIAQVGLANMAPPFAIVVSGATFPATLVPGSDSGKTFSVTAPLTPELLTAVRDATTARISVNDGYAFAESDVDPAQAFETFTAACSTLTGVVTPSK